MSDRVAAWGLRCVRPGDTVAIAGGGLVAIAVAATLGEGGGSVTALLGWHALLAAILTLIALVRRETGSHAFGAPSVALAFGAFLLVVVAGSLRAPYFYAWLTAAIELAAAVAIALTAARCGPAWSRLAAPCLAAAGAIQAAWFLCEGFALGAARPAATFLNPNHLALWLVMVALVATGTLPDSRRGRALLALALAVIGLALVVVASRGAWLGLVVGASWRLARERQRLTLRARAVLALGAVVTLVIAGWFVARRLHVDPFPMHRTMIWRSSLGELARAPWTGVGLGQFPAAAARLRFDDGQGPFRYDRSYDATHSDWIRVPVELGLPAAVLLGAALVLGARSIARRRRETGWPPAADGAIAALLAAGAQAMVDNPSRWPAAYVLAAALAGSLYGEPVKRGQVRWPLPARALLVAVSGIAWVAADVGPTLAWLEARGLPHGRLAPPELATLDRALERNRIHPDLWLRRAEHFASGGRLDGHALAREAAEHAVRLEPSDARYRWGLARVEGQACVELLRDRATCARAGQAFEEAIARSPHDPRILLDAAGLRMAIGDAEEAARLAERALAVEPNAASAMAILAEALAELGFEDGERRVSDLVAQATELARRERQAASENRYSAELLAVDAARLDRIARRIEERSWPR